MMRSIALLCAALCFVSRVAALDLPPFLDVNVEKYEFEGDEENMRNLAELKAFTEQLRKGPRNLGVGWGGGGGCTGSHCSDDGGNGGYGSNDGGFGKGKGFGKGGKKGSKRGKGGKGGTSSKSGKGGKGGKGGSGGTSDDSNSGNGGNGGNNSDDHNGGGNGGDNGDNGGSWGGGWGDDNEFPDHNPSVPGFHFALIRDQIGSSTAGLGFSASLGMSGRVFEVLVEQNGELVLGTQGIGLFYAVCTAAGHRGQNADLLCSYEINVQTQGGEGVGAVIANGPVVGPENRWLVTGAEWDFFAYEGGYLDTIMDPTKPILYASLFLV